MRIPAQPVQQHCAYEIKDVYAVRDLAKAELGRPCGMLIIIVGTTAQSCPPKAGVTPELSPVPHQLNEVAQQKAASHTPLAEHPKKQNVLREAPGSRMWQAKVAHQTVTPDVCITPHVWN